MEVTKDAWLWKRGRVAGDGSEDARGYDEQRTGREGAGQRGMSAAEVTRAERGRGCWWQRNQAALTRQAVAQRDVCNGRREGERERGEKMGGERGEEKGGGYRGRQWAGGRVVWWAAAKRGRGQEWFIRGPVCEISARSSLGLLTRGGRRGRLQAPSAHCCTLGAVCTVHHGQIAPARQRVAVVDSFFT